MTNICLFGITSIGAYLDPITLGVFPVRDNPRALASGLSSVQAVVVVGVLLFYVHGKHLRSCRDGQLT